MKAFWLVCLLSGVGCASARPTGIYFVMVDRFANGAADLAPVDQADPQAFHGGDLQGLIERLDWIAALGFDTVWLSPVFAMRTETFHGYGAFHGYWTSDLTRLEPRFGDEATLLELRRQLDRRGMKLILDVVLNHVGPEAPLVAAHPDWFHHRGGITDWNDADQLVNNDVHGLPDLAVEREEVFQYLLGAVRRWVRLVRPDGLRLDAVKHVPTAFWERFNGEFRGLLTLGELLDGRTAEVAQTWRQGRFDSMFDFPLGFAVVDVFCKDAPFSRLATVLTDDRRYDDPTKLVTLVDNHDLPRLMSACRGELPRVERALRFLLAMRGTPSLAWGTEIGATGEKEPANRASMQFVEHPLHQVISDAMATRRARSALTGARSVVLEVSDERLRLARVAANGQSVIISVDRAQLSLADGPTVGAAFTIPVRFEGEGAVVGSGPELGDWDLTKAVPLPATIELPAYGVFELKRVRSGAFEAGGNHVLHVTPGTTQMNWSH